MGIRIGDGDGEMGYRCRWRCGVGVVYGVGLWYGTYCMGWYEKRRGERSGDVGVGRRYSMYIEIGR